MVLSYFFHCELPDRIYDEVVFQRGGAHCYRSLRTCTSHQLCKLGNIFMNNIGLKKKSFCEWKNIKIFPIKNFVKSKEQGKVIWERKFFQFKIITIQEKNQVSYLIYLFKIYDS